MIKYLVFLSACARPTVEYPSCTATDIPGAVYCKTEGRQWICVDDIDGIACMEIPDVVRVPDVPKN